MEELISVIVVAYNSSATLIETLDSIRNQTYNNIEIVLTDDASRDDTVRLAEEWKKHNKCDNMLIISSEKNTGPSGNVNRGIYACSGRLMKLMAGDDTLMPNAIEEYYQAYNQAASKTIIMSKVHLFGTVTDAVREFCEDSYKTMQMSREEQYKKMLAMNTIVSPSIGLINVEEAKRLGGYDERFPFLDDYPFFLKFYLDGYGFSLLNKELYNYRISPNSLGNGVSWQYLKSMADFYFSVRMKLQYEEKMFATMCKQIIRYSNYRILAAIKRTKSAR